MIKKMKTAPCKLNAEPYLTEWHADLESGMEIWIQTSEDENNPKWKRLGDILENKYLEYGVYMFSDNCGGCTDSTSNLKDILNYK